MILRVLVASFHHRNGNQIDYAVPAFDADSSSASTAEGSPVALPHEFAALPFLCIPDGAHALHGAQGSDEDDDSDDHFQTQRYGGDFVYFQVPMKGSRPIFGVSCFRQIPASELNSKPDDVTRTMVQKAVVVLTSEPIFGPLVQKLGLVTKSYFEQRDFANLEIIDELYQSLKNTFHSFVSDLDLHFGLNLRETVTKFKGSTLQIFKLLLLEKRILFFGTNTTQLGVTQYGIMSLFPGLLRSFCHLKPEDVAATSVESANELRAANDHHDVLGFPLKIFDNESSLFLPYISLHQIDLLTSPEVKAFVFGSSNSIFAVQRGSNIDAIVNTDTGIVEILNTELKRSLKMTASDRSFIEDLVDTVVDSWDYDHENLDSDPMGDYEGSDNYIRARFEAYLVSLFATVKNSLLVLDEESQLLVADFNSTWVDAWMDTENFKDWSLNPTVELGPELLKTLGHVKRGALEDPFEATLQGIRKSIVTPLQTNVVKALEQAEAGISTAVTNLTDPEQQKLMQEKLAATMANASKAAGTALSSAKETAQDFGKVAEAALTNAGKAAESALSNAGKAAQEGFTNVVAGFKDSNALQENAVKVMSNVGTNAKSLWTAVGTWGGSLFGSSGSLTDHVDTQREILLLDEESEHDPFVVGDSSSIQNLKFHDGEDDTLVLVPTTAKKTAADGSGEVGSFV